MFTVRVQAYIDPSVMTYAIQAVAGMAIAIGAVLGIYWRKIRRYFLNRFHLEQKTNKNYETDDLCFNDPETNTVIRPDLSGVHAETAAESDAAGEKKESFLHAMIPACFISAALSFLFTVYGPLELYFNNQGEFQYDFRALVPVVLMMFIGVMLLGIIAFAAGRFIFDQLFEVMLAAASVLLVCSYIQGSFLIGNMPPMDGTAIDWGLYTHDELISLILWIVVIILTALIYRFFEKKGFHAFVKGLSVLLTLTQLITLVRTGFVTKGFDSKENIVFTHEGEFEMSTDKNVVILILDAADGKLFTDTAASDPAYASYFKDFTFYPDALAAYPFTQYSIPFILSGAWNENQEDFHQFETKAIEHSPLLNRAKNENYTVSLYEDAMSYGSREFKEELANVNVTGKYIGHRGSFLKQMFKLVWFKYAPFTMKRTFQPDLVQLNRTVQYTDGSVAYDYIDSVFRDLMRGSTVTLTPEKQFKFIHIEGAHVPFDMDEKANTIPAETGNYSMKLKASIELTNEYLTMLKNAGVYDNTAIIIMADHGYNYENDVSYGYASKRQNPLIMAKGFNENNESLQISDKPVSFDDLQNAYQNLMDGKAGSELFDFVPDDRASRRFLYYVFLDEDHLIEYEWKGKAYDITAGTPTGASYSLND